MNNRIGHGSKSHNQFVCVTLCSQPPKNNLTQTLGCWELCRIDKQWNLVVLQISEPIQKALESMLLFILLITDFSTKKNKAEIELSLSNQFWFQFAFCWYTERLCNISFFKRCFKILTNWTLPLTNNHIFWWFDTWILTL